MSPTPAPELRFRIRHLLIVAIYFAVLLGVLVPALRYYDAMGTFNASLAILLISPWLLGMLVLVLERKGPVKYWAAPILLSLTSPALAIWHDWIILDTWNRSGAVPNVIVSLLVNILLIGSFTYFLARLGPDRCPKCGHRALIPLLHLWKRSRRTAKTRWCGACGAQYWREGKGIWQKERRVTWVDVMAGNPALDCQKENRIPKPFGIRADRPSSTANPSREGA